jgi:hypothetical protein
MPLPTELDLVGQGGYTRANVNRLRQHGAVAVRYAANGYNIELEVLQDCAGAGTYVIQPHHASRSRTIKTVQDLFLQMPATLSRLSSKLQGNRFSSASEVEGNRFLRVDDETVAIASLPAGSAFRKSDLRGTQSACAKATHIVSAIHLGGFAIFAGDGAKLAARATVFGLGAADQEGRSMELIESSGTPEACEAATRSGEENEGCRTPLRIALSPLEETRLASPLVAPAVADPSPR